MINNIKTVFSIKDLENLSGIKAHTIRIWEKRYNILEPMRTDTNIRLYNLKNLQKLLNITLLHQYGYKISKIATYSEEKIQQLIREIISKKNSQNFAINSFKMAMMNFDQEIFFNTFDWLISEKTFKEVFKDHFLPLLKELGLLWQSETITPANEHFMSHLIKQKIIIHTESLQILKPTKTDKVFVLSLPLNEIHEIGLLYLQYEILLQGYKTVYLGESMPIENLEDLTKHFENITFVSFMTIQPDRNIINQYVKTMEEKLLKGNNEIWLMGSMTEHIDRDNLSEKIRIFSSMDETINQI
ncbi:MerR family transcriptional regulator [Flavobacterium sp. Fl-77]|uniref:MerR family transcriptional regulator n=1 Tax=Flavobacterium flavipigmentatum TaxID=2893884 RepID=A0AAJ2S8R0_9FLAO|nr:MULTISPECIES: MerR family transcriptional regulator [unclassified Flavobacterium]MDX6182520.1 MerR family transcriptional regulator [Flavobacterium sp. Fl-33]MDX6185567.1 MerR family transcriptional regulator [Flavobacterium sp. Fl-77]UFH38756.1 MerR family transcriptional regulator [Flavobacterium sp. F-70]